MTLIAMGHNHLELKEFREAADAFERYLDDFSGGPAEPEAMRGLTNPCICSRVFDLGA